MKNLVIFFTVILISSSFAQERQGSTFNLLSSKTSIGIDGGVTYTKSDFKDSKFDYIINMVGDYYFPTRDEGIFGISVAGSYGYAASSGRPGYKVYYPPLDEFRTQIMMLSGGISYTLTNSGFVYPYILTRAGWINYQPKDKDGNELERNKQNKYSPNDWFAYGELGLKFMLNKYVSFNIAASIDYLPFDNLDDSPNSITGGSDNDIFFTFMGGIHFYFGGISDTDNDGVRDEDDICSNTPQGVIVDEFGCPVDSDKDGIPDYLDKCPNTPKNIPVNMDGCPLDADGDGVPDYLDLCNDTPLNVKVDSRGCPLDTDEDGVPDYKDLCPNTPIGTEVNKWGCPIEEKIYKPIEKKEIILNGKVTFESNKSELLVSAFTELEKIVQVMNDYPETMWKIEGHTDNTGTEKLNKELSLKRAKAVYDFFVKKGIDPSRLSVYGYGSEFPVADNKTENGKLLNRRVTIVLVTDYENNSSKIKTNEDNKSFNLKTEKNIGNMVYTDGYKYCLQVSSWRSKDKAESEMNKLKAMGYDAFIVTANIPELDGIWYRVRIGYFDSLDEIDRLRSNLNK